MTELLMLYGLGLMHAGFAGFREASGRSLLIDKRRYYTRAVLRGLAMGQGASAIIFFLLLGLYLTAADPDGLLRLFGQAGRAALVVYLGYTALVLAAFVPYLIPSLESRTLTIIAVFGPLTLLLPIVVLLGAGAAILRVPTGRVALFFAVSAAAIAMVEPALAAGGWSRRAAEAPQKSESR